MRCKSGPWPRPLLLLSILFLLPPPHPSLTPDLGPQGTPGAESRNTALDKKNLQLTTRHRPGPQTVPRPPSSTGNKALSVIPASPTKSGPASPTKRASHAEEPKPAMRASPTKSALLKAPKTTNTALPAAPWSHSPTDGVDFPPSAPVSLLHVAPSPSAETFPITSLPVSAPPEITASPTSPSAPPFLSLETPSPSGPPVLFAYTTPSTPVSCPSPSSPPKPASLSPSSPTKQAPSSSLVSSIKPAVIFPLSSPTKQEPSSPSPSPTHPTLFPSPPSTPPRSTTPPSPAGPPSPSPLPAEELMEI